LYDAQAGGVRRENDILITETGSETLTRSKILYLEAPPAADPAGMARERIIRTSLDYLPGGM
ncbi:MAG: hypothetical protein LBQ57_05745, partial [Spirochaetales bacterium]|nr:hypothetical protein [Spirochaetales bacterium]